MAKTKTKKTTTDNLAKIMTSGFKRQEEMIDEKIDDLAAMTKRGFDEAAKNLEVVKNDVCFLKNDFQEMKEKITNIEKLILQQHSFQIKELETKVKYIEEALAIDK